MCRLKSCGCLPLNIGTTIVGVVEIICAVALLLGVLSHFKHHRNPNSSKKSEPLATIIALRISPRSISNHAVNKTLEDSTYVGIIFASLLMITTGVLLLYAAKSENRCLLVPWLIGRVVIFVMFLIWGVTVFQIAASFCKNFKEPEQCSAFSSQATVVVYSLFIVSAIFPWFVVYSYFVELKRRPAS